MQFKLVWGTAVIGNRTIVLNPLIDAERAIGWENILVDPGGCTLIIPL